jgi:pyruvate/2-oxoglutarate dehydrogenase complex dihydrolipoamide acyltransferase (E2) component
MNRIGEYHVTPFSLSRQIGSDWVELGKQKHHMTALLEFDVTEARKAIRAYRRRTGRGLSFFAWMVKCISQAVSEHKEINAYRHGKRRLVLFDDVDIAVTMERMVEGARTPTPHVVRRANAKSLDEIHEEIASAQATEVTGSGQVLGERKNPWVAWAYRLVPEVLRRLISRKFTTDAFYLKRTMGTVVITSLGMYGKLSGWGISAGLHTLCCTLGGIVKKPRVMEGRVESREFLHLTLLIDHDIVDGAPAARFVARLNELVEQGWGLDEG